MAKLFRWFLIFLSKLQPEEYVINVRNAESQKRTYLPDINGNYPDDPSGTRPMDNRDLAGRRDLGWRE